MTNIPLGLECEVFLQDGTYALPTWTAVDAVVDASINTEVGSAEVSRRGSGGFRQWKMTLKDVTVDITFIKDKDDVEFSAIETAMQTGAYVELAVADGQNAVGTDWFNALFEVESWEEGQELEEGATIDATLKVVPPDATDDVSPNWGTGVLPASRP